jgi:hypothetical protein
MKNNCCDGISLPSYNNELEILVRQLKREVEKLMTTTEARLLCQSKKIDETMIYIKNNLSNALRDLLDSMLESGEIEEIITSAISNAISLLETEVEQLRSEVHSNDQDIENLKNNKLEFTKYEDTDINRKFLNIDVSTEYVNNSIVYITKLKNIDKLSCLPTNGNPTGDVLSNITNVKDYAKNHPEYDVYMNCGMCGIYIFDGVVNQSTRLDCPYYCGFTADNEMKFYMGLNGDITPATLQSDGIVNCFSGFVPIIRDHQLVDYSDITSLYNTNTIAKAFTDSLPVKHPRQLIAQDDNNNFYIFSIMGRFNNCEGFNYSEMQNYFINKNLKNVFSCDGGGSTQTIYNKDYIFYPSQELDTNIDRSIPSILGFRLKEVE